MLIDTDAMIDLAGAFPARKTAVLSGAYWRTVGGWLEVHRGPLHARVPLKVFAKDRELGWHRLDVSALTAQDTVELESLLVPAAAPLEAQQLRAVWRDDSAALVPSKHRLFVNGREGSWTRPHLSVPKTCCLGLGWRILEPLHGAARIADDARILPPTSFGSRRERRAARLAEVKVREGVYRPPEPSVYHHPFDGFATLPPGWLHAPTRLVPHAGGVAMHGGSWWLGLRANS
jgi:hypothetical protein